MEEQLQVGVITATHGLNGEVKVFPTTDDPKRFEALEEVILDTGKESLSLKIEKVKYFKQFVILKFKGIDHINEIEKYVKKSLYVTRENAVPLGENEYFIADLMGMKVIDEQEADFGVLKEVIQTGANDVYVITMADGREVLVPAVKECILKVDMEQQYIKIHLLPGLLDL